MVAADDLSPENTLFQCCHFAFLYNNKMSSIFKNYSQGSDGLGSHSSSPSYWLCALSRLLTLSEPPFPVCTTKMLAVHGGHRALGVRPP